MTHAATKTAVDENAAISEYESEKVSNKISVLEKAYVRKLDYLHVLPFVFIISFLQYLDKTALNYASVLGIIEDTNITHAQYGFSGSIFFLGFFLAQAPSGLFIQKVPVGKCLGILSVIWGCVLALTSQVKTFAHLALLRLILGVFEGGVYPCCIMLISTMYRRREQAQRFAFLSFGNALAMSAGGFISYGIGHMVDVGGLKSWQWLMILLGIITILFGICCFFFLVDNPKSKSFRLTPEEESMVDLRISDNAVTVSRKINYSHIKESLKESRYYCYIVAGFFANFQNGSMMTFTSIIIKNLGFSNLNAILLGVPCGIIITLCSVFGVLFIRYHGNTHYVIAFTFSLAIMGIVLLLVIPVFEAKIVGLYIWWANGSGLVLLFSVVANNVSGYSKKIFYSSSLNAAYCVGSFIGPQLMFDSQKPLYIGAMTTYIAVDAVAVILILIARHIMSNSNKKRLNTSVVLTDNKEDLTDRENSSFFYKL